MVNALFRAHERPQHDQNNQYFNKSILYTLMSLALVSSIQIQQLLLICTLCKHYYRNIYAADSDSNHLRYQLFGLQ